MSTWIVLDDEDTALKYSGQWFEQNTNGSQNPGNYGPAYKNTLHGVKSNASLEFIFSGPEIQIIGTNNITNSSDGVQDPIWRCLVDGVDITSAPFKFPENNWLFCSTGNASLSSGPHTLTVDVVVKSQTFWLDNIQYMPPSDFSLNGETVRVDDLDPQVQAGLSATGWEEYATISTFTQMENSSLTYEFFGTALTWYGFLPIEYFNTSVAEGTYIVDGGPAQNFNISPRKSGATLYNQIFFQVDNLSSAKHQLQVFYHGNSSTMPLILDYLIVEGVSASGSAHSDNGTTVTTPVSPSLTSGGSTGDYNPAGGNGGASLLPSNGGTGTTPTNDGPAVSTATPPSVTTSSYPARSGGKINAGAIVGIVVGVLLIVTITAAWTVFYLRWRRAKHAVVGQFDPRALVSSPIPSTSMSSESESSPGQGLLAEHSRTRRRHLWANEKSGYGFAEPLRMETVYEADSKSISSLRRTMDRCIRDSTDETRLNPPAYY